MSAGLPYFVTWTAQKDAVTLPVASAHDSVLVLRDGREVVDLVSTSFQASFGHSHPALIGPMRAQLDSMLVAAPKAALPLKERESERLLRLLEGAGAARGGKIFYTTSGAESVENALKMARQIRGKALVAARARSYHGASLGALSVTGDWRNEPHFTVDDWTLRIPEPGDDPDFSRAREAITRAGGGAKVAAVIVETISGANGVIVPPQPWWDGIAALRRDEGVLLIVDEVLCGFGRTGTPFGFQQFGVKPDLICMSKAITGGYVPFGAVWASPEIARFYQDTVLSCGLTHYAHPLGLAAMSGALDLMEDAAFWKQAAETAAVFAAELDAFREVAGVKGVRYRGMLGAVDFKAGGWKRHLGPLAMDEGLFVILSDAMMVLAPPLTIDPDLLRRSMAKLRAYAGKVGKA